MKPLSSLAQHTLRKLQSCRLLEFSWVFLGESLSSCCVLTPFLSFLLQPQSEERTSCQCLRAERVPPFFMLLSLKTTNQPTKTPNQIYFLISSTGWFRYLNKNSWYNDVSSQCLLLRDPDFFLWDIVKEMIEQQHFHLDLLLNLKLLTQISMSKSDETEAEGREGECPKQRRLFCIVSLFSELLFRRAGESWKGTWLHPWVQVWPGHASSDLFLETSPP